MSTFVLVHSPLCGPTTWQPVARELHALGHSALVPRLVDVEQVAEPLWQQQAQSIATALQHVPQHEPLIWVSHSGAGLRLPAYRAAVNQRAAAYVFVDSGVPHDVGPQGMSQLDNIARHDAAFAANLRGMLAQERRFPEWDDASLREIIPDDALRHQTLMELQPRGLRYFAEPLPVFAGWPDAPCAYLLFTSAYAADAEYAEQHGWPLQRMAGQHFHMLVDAPAVARAITELARQAVEHRPT